MQISDDRGRNSRYHLRMNARRFALLICMALMIVLAIYGITPAVMLHGGERIKHVRTKLAQIVVRLRIPF